MKLLMLIVLLAASGFSGRASVMIAGTSQSVSFDPIANTNRDLAFGIIPVLTGNYTFPGTSTAACLTDGKFGSANIQSGNVYFYAQNNCTATFDLGQPMTINEIDVYSGWANNGRANQNYTVSYSVDGTNYYVLTTVAQTFMGSATPSDFKVALTDSAVTNLFPAGARFIQFSFSNVENGGVAYPEIVILGVTNAPVLPAQPVDTAAGALDMVYFGYTNSEVTHALTTTFPLPTATNITYTYPPASNPSVGPPSLIVYGGLGQLARQLLPRTPVNDMYGGELDFTMLVDPVAQNYFTLRLWGSDTMSQMLILNCNGYEVGGRHGYDYEEGSLTEDAGGWFPNRFSYRTIKLPLRLTLGQTNVALKIRSAGFINIYGSGYTPNYQFLMNGPTFGLSRAYTHTNSFLDVTGETQGAVQPAPPIRPSPASSQIAVWTTAVNSKVTSLLAANSNSFSADNVDFLAQTYGVNWSIGYTNPAVVTRVTAAIDAMVTIAATNSGGLQGYMASFGNPSWGGYFGPVGDAISLLWPQLSNSLSTTVNYGGVIGTTTRKAGWSAALRASVDSGRYNRKSVSNQELLNDFNIYKANRGLELVDFTNALTETNALRYLYEAAGISPYLGNDLTGGGSNAIPGIAPFGTNWFFITSKGTSKENGMATDYGEVAFMVYDMARLSGDTNLFSQALKMFRARCQFRFPAIDTSGYAEMMAPAPVGCRRNSMPGFEGYLTQWEQIRAAADNAAPDLVGYFQQQMADNQFFQVLSTEAADAQVADGPYLPNYYSNAVALAATNIRLPMTTNAPDFAWGDEENMVITAKHGEERFFTSLAWRLDTGNSGQAINGMASVFLVAPTFSRTAEILVNDVQYTPAGTYVTRNGSVDVDVNPPDNAAYPNAETGNQYAIALRPDLTGIPAANQDGGRGTAYTLRYGNWLVAINAHPSNNYTMLLPSNFTSGTNLITGQVMSGPVILAPKTSMVFYLNTVSDPVAAAPVKPLLLAAAGRNNLIALNWSLSGGAAGYNLKRSTTGGGPYTTIASGLTTNVFADTNVLTAVTYFYVVTAVSAAGESAASPEAIASAGLPSPWQQTDVGAVGIAGGASYNTGRFTVTGSGGGMPYNPPSQCHFVYQTMTGNGSIIARLVSPANINALSKTGVIMRGGLADSSQEFFVNLQPSPLQATFQQRLSVGGSAGAASTNITGTTWWLKVTRSGNTFTGYASPDGVSWTQVGSSQTPSSIPSTIYVGLFVSALDNTQTGFGVFDNVSTPNWMTPGVSVAPTNLIANATATTAVLTWSNVSGATSYNVKRSLTNGGSYALIANGLTNAFYTDTGLVGGTKYYYVVSDIALGGESANSLQAVVQTVSLSPVQLATSAGNGQLTLSWPADHTGWLVQVQTNSLSAGLGTNWLTLSNTAIVNGYTNFITPANGTVFYRLIYP